MLKRKRVYLLNVGIKTYLFYGKKIQCNNGMSIVYSGKFYVHPLQSYDKSLESLNMIKF